MPDDLVVELEILAPSATIIEIPGGLPGADGTDGASTATEVSIPLDTMPSTEGGFGPVGAQNLLAYLQLIDAAIAATAGGALDPELEAIAALVSAADTVAYFTGPGTAMLASYTPFGRQLTALLDAPALRSLAVLGNSATRSVGTTNAQVAAGDAPAIAVAGEAAARATSEALLVPKTTQVNGHALNGNVTVTKGDVGLGNVTNDAQVKRTEMGVASGVATLDGGGKVPAGQLPSSVMEYQGVWNAATNTPTLADGSGSIGDVYRVSVAGTVNLGSGAIIFDVGDYAVLNASLVWEKSDTTDSVPTVFGRTGNVVAADGDYTAAQVVFSSSGLLIITGVTRVQAALGLVDAALDSRYTKSAADARFAQIANNLGDLANKATSRTNLGVAIGSDVQAFSAQAAFRTDKLSAFAATTSAELASIISDESGTGLLLFGTSPHITTPTGIVKGDVGLGNLDNTSDANKPVSTAQATAIALRLLASANFSDLTDLVQARNNLGLGSAALLAAGGANGALVLDAGGKIPSANLGAAVMEWKGTWDASTNTPTLVDGTGNTGDVYRVTAAASRNLGSGAIDFQVGDMVIYNGTIWEKSDTTDSVPTVFGRTGNVVAAANDYSAAQVSFSPSGLLVITVATTVQAALAAVDAALDARYTKIAADARYVQQTVSVNGHALSGNISLSAADVGADASGAAAAAQAASQPLNSGLTSISALSTTAYGRGLLTLANEAALRSYAGLGTAATSAIGDFDAAGAAATAQTNAQSYADNLVSGAITGLSWKPPARVAATTNLTLSGTQTIDGVAVIAGDRVLATGQTTGANNGPWVVAAGAWTRPTDFDSSSEALPGSVIPVSEGTSNGNAIWVLTTDAPITLGSTTLTFVKVPMSAPVTSVDGGTGAVVLAVDAAANVGSHRTLGTGALQATAGNDSRLSDQRVPTDNSVTSAKIVDGTVVNADLANMANATFKGRTTAGTGVPEDLTAAQVNALLPVVTPTAGTNLKGLMSAADKTKVDTMSTVSRTTQAGGPVTLTNAVTYLGYTAVTAGTGANIVTLPLASTMTPGSLLVIADESGQAMSTGANGGVQREIQIKPNATLPDTVEGFAPTTFEVIRDPFGSVSLICDGVSNWQIVAVMPAVRKEVFTTSGVWRKSLISKTVHLFMIGGGGGGAGGERNVASTAGVAGGSGGTAGAFTELWFDAQDCANTETVTVGAAGAAGAAQGITGVSKAGGAGGDSKFTVQGTVAFVAGGGGGGLVGSGTGFTGGPGVGSIGRETGGVGGYGQGNLGGSVTPGGTSGGNITFQGLLAGGGGGGGGGVGSSAATDGANGGAGPAGFGLTGAQIPGGAVVGGGNGGAGGTGTAFGASPFSLGALAGGGGGAGGAGKFNSGTTGTGGAGGKYGGGGGGGGGGAGVNGAAGGAGGVGIVVVWTYR